jgi:hypothetical protein
LSTETFYPEDNLVPIGKLANLKNIYDQSAFENKSVSNSFLTSIGSYWETLHRIRVDKTKIHKDSKKEEDMLNKRDVEYQWTEIEDDNNFKKRWWENNANSIKMLD